MRCLMTAVLVLATGACYAATPVTEGERPPELDCKAGPLHKVYGNGDWLVYGCSDSRSAVVVSDAGNPASPFYFIFFVKTDGAMQRYGEGNGKQAATQAAFDELKTLSQSDVAELVAQAQATGAEE